MARGVANAAMSQSRRRAKSRTVRLVCTALMLRAQAMVNAGKPREASRSIAQANELGAWSLREHLGMFWQVCSQIQRESNELQEQSQQRARRIWREQGNVCAEKELETQTAKPTHLETRDMRDPSLNCEFATR